MIKKVVTFFRETMSFNQSQSLCIIKSKKYGLKNINASFKFDIIGIASDLKMDASEIVNNEQLLNRFSYDDKSEIIFCSGACVYTLLDITMSDIDDEYWVSIAATFKKDTFVKKFSIEEILNHPLLFNSLEAKNKKTITALVDDKKVINIEYFLSK